MEHHYATVLALIVTAGGLVFATISGWNRRMKNYTEQRRRLRVWRKQHGVRQHTRAKGDPPIPFYVRTKLGDPGDPRTGVSPRDTDNFLAAIRRAFSSGKGEK